MSKYDDEFKNVKKGLPSQNTSEKATFNFVILFVVVGIMVAIALALFHSAINSEGVVLVSYGLGYVPEQVIMNALLALLVGSIQAWILSLESDLVHCSLLASP